MKMAWLNRTPARMRGDGCRYRQARLAGCTLLLITAALASGCSFLGPVPNAPAGPEPAAEPTVTPDSEPAASAEPANTRPDVEPAIPPAPRQVLVLRSSDSASSQHVARTLEGLLTPDYELFEMNPTDGEELESLQSHGTEHWAAAIAIGADAAEFAAETLAVPTIFCQIFDYEALLSKNADLFGVEALPPLDLQLRSWKRIAGEANSVGIIVAEQDTELAAAAREAAAAAGIDLHLEFAATDREVLYRFKRFAPTVDGLWLLPSDDILSPRVLREVLEYAADHDVQSIVFNETLLQWGALLSVGSDPGDVARTVAAVLDTILHSGPSEVSRVTPLSTVDVQINEQAAIDLGLGAALLTQSHNRTASGNAR